MMRLAGSACLVVVLLLLLASVSTAWAECAWVLWTSGSGTGGSFTGQPEKTWPGGAFATRAECEEVRSQQLARLLSTTTPGAKAFRTGDMVTIVMGESSGAVVVKYTAICLPDTVDPRAPKGR